MGNCKNLHIKNIKSIENSKSNNIFETCIGCGEETNILRGENINNRFGYVIGLGQLCISCYKRYSF